MSSVFLCTNLIPTNKIALDSTPPPPFLRNEQFFLRRISSNTSTAKSLSAVSGLVNPVADVTPARLKKPMSAEKESYQGYTVSYLIDSIGLSPEAATTASEKVQFGSPEKPESVLTLLRNYGFTKTQITVLVKKRPVLLLANPEKTLLPKLEFFHSIGVSRTNLTRILSLDPTLLTRSLENQIIPSYKFLKSVVQSDEKVCAAMKRTSWVFLEDHTKSLVPNIALLRNIEVPETSIALLMTHFPEAVIQKHEQFRDIVTKVMEMGFNPMKSTFVLAIHVFSGKGNKAIWDRCYEEYKKWGWSHDDILAAFKKHPHCLILSTKKISRSMDFLVNKMGWPTEVIARCPVVLFFSLEKRMVPRCSVIQVLSSKGLLKRHISLSTVLLPAEKCFLDRFVHRYEEEVPQLLSVYEGKIDASELC